MKLNFAITITLILSFFTYHNSYSQTLNEVSIHGFGGWAYGKTDNKNRYLMGNKNGNYDYINFSLNISAKPYENLTTYFQTSFNEDFDKNDVKLDYAFAEWYINDLLTFRIGKVKTPSMLYSEIYNVGTLRPFFMLPQGVYHDIAPEAYKGGGITGTLYSKDNWDVSYDLYGGKVEMLPLRLPIDNMDTDEGNRPLRFAYYNWYGTDMIGGKLAIDTPLDGLSFSFASFSADIGFEFRAEGLSFDEEPDERYTFYGFSSEYLSDMLWVRGEYLLDDETEYRFDTGYAEGAYKFTDHWQIAGRYERENRNGAYSSTEDRHEEVAGGINYWINPNFVLKFSYHNVNGNSFAIPDKSDYFGGTLAEETNLIIIGTQFSF